MRNRRADQGRILEGISSRGEAPPERDLAESLKVNRATVREAIRSSRSWGWSISITGTASM
jgi:DNA-binding FadR family transcriptional regulator